VVIGGEKGDIRVFDSTTGAVTTPARGHRAELMALACQPGSSVVASASAEADLCLWDAASGRELKRVDGGLSLFALAFRPVDGTLAAGGVARRLTLYEPKTLAQTAGMTLETPNMIASLAWSPDGRLLAIGHIDSDTLGKGGARVVDASTRAVVTTLDTRGAPTFRLAFAGAGTVVGAYGRELRAWPAGRASIA
jgi:WD40 repeat protein